MTDSVQSYSRPSHRSYESMRREDAENRNAKWASLTPQQQLDSLAKRRGESKKQIARIKERMEETVKV